MSRMIAVRHRSRWTSWGLRMQGCYENFLDRAPRGAHREFCGQSFWFAASLSDTFAAAFAYFVSRSLYPFPEPKMICAVEEVL